ncbi:LOW QUALITY PROTEIN: hypothetical protein U9M48_042375 [Paspalum notatum var. saurae]|uniref:Ubiquitin-like protease family profile domain-containing protein n=1 Tax=Paspalum notatum var. saurae TaxID=547442 RepID=A0AAQ3UQP7_PASNO
MVPLHLHLRAMPHSLPQATQRTAVQVLTTGDIVIKIQQLPALERPKFEAKLAAHDQAVEQQIATIKDCLTSIVDKQFDLKDTFYEMIDDRPPTMKKRLNHPMIMIMPHKSHALILRSPGIPLDTPVTGTQAEIIYERQQHMRRSFETCPNDFDTEAPVHADRTAQQNATVQINLEDDALAAANELMTNLNIAAQGISERTSTSPPAEPGLLKFDVSAQDPIVPTVAAPLTSSNQNPCNTGGSEETGGVLQPDNGPVFDETPWIIHAAHHIHCQYCEAYTHRKPETTVMDFGGYTSTCQDVKESFADGASLDSVFMQYFIECVRSDNSANLPSSNTSRLILDTNVGIMVPMLRGGHWSLYVVNTVRRCVDILDSNPYGPALGGTTWRTYHNAQVVDTNGVKLPWSRLIMNRLNKALQRARPKSSIPKFGNYKIDLAPNCPTMNPGSNDCGFFCYKIHSVL